MKILSTVAALIVAGATAQAGIFTFTAILTGAAETPPNGSAGLGVTVATYDSGTASFDLNGTYAGLSSSATAAHVHGGAVGVAGPVIIPLTVAGNAAGNISGSATLTANQFHHLYNGDWYVNIHDATFPGGEIRGQLLLTSIPEPETYAALAGVGLLGFAAWRRFKA